MSSRGSATRTMLCHSLDNAPSGKDYSALPRQELADMRRTCQAGHGVPHSTALTQCWSVRLRYPPPHVPPSPSSPIFIFIVVVVVRTLLLIALLVLP